MRKNRLTQEEFERRSSEVHNGKYDYSKTVYTSSQNKVIVTCKKHGDFEQNAGNHMHGSGCPRCYEKHNFTKEIFIEKAKQVHNDIYDYSKVKYVNSYTPVEIVCSIHSSFLQKPVDHLRGCDCPICAKKEADLKLIVPWEKHVEKARKIHGDRYEYIKEDNWKSSKDPITIVCLKHGMFKQRIWDHLSGEGCPSCSIEKMRNTKTFTTENFIDKAKEVHGDKYDYSLVKYEGATKKKVCIVCTKHGIFKQLPSSHVQGVGCPSCNSSKLEKIVEEILILADVKFTMQYMNDGMKNIHLFKYDFLVNEELVIECQGIQHFKPIDYFGGKDAFKKQKRWDKMKKDIAIKNGFRYLEIPYYLSNDEIKNLIERVLNV